MIRQNNNLEKLWKELKRRKVVRVIAMYAGTAFILLQLAEILTPALLLPDWTTRLVTLLLIIFFPLVVIFSWIFDLTPEGIKKTESIDSSRKRKSPPVPVKKSLEAGRLVMIFLIIAAGVFAYLKVSNRDKFRYVRDTDGKISIAVVPFENLTGDTTLDWFQRGISSLIINGLGSSNELAVRDDQTMFEAMESMHQVFTAPLTSSMAKEVAEKTMAETYISGSFQGREGIYWILVNLIDTHNGNVLWTNKIKGDLKSSEYLILVDSLCKEIKDYLEIRALEKKTDYDFREAYTKSAEAYRYFIQGVNLILASEYEPAINYFKDALEIDSTFTFANFYMAVACNFSNPSLTNNQVYLYTQRAFQGKRRLPLKYQYWLDLWHACFFGKDPQEIIRYCNLLENSGIESRLLWLDLGATYVDFLQQYDKAIGVYKRIEELDRERGYDWKFDMYYGDYCEALLLANRPEDVRRISEKGLKINPENFELVLYLGSSHLMLGDTVSAGRSISEIKSLATKNYFSASAVESAIGDLYLWAKDTLSAEKHYRKAYDLDPENRGRIDDLILLLVRYEINIEEGLELTLKALGSYPERPYWLWMKGLALYKLGRIEEALEILKEADERYSIYRKELKEDILEAENALQAS